jgi:Zn-finger nucleic acid-binding protein
MQCPVCDVPLSISSREGVEIDFCPQCRGVWLDRGELDKIIDRASVAMAPTGPTPGYSDRPPPRYEQDRGYDPRYDDRRYDDDWRHKKRKRRGSFLEDLFDFD